MHVSNLPRPYVSAFTQQPRRAWVLLTLGLMILGAQGATAEDFKQKRAEFGQRDLDRLGLPSLRPLALTDTVWIGHSIQTYNPFDYNTYSTGPYHVGRGNNRPGTDVAGNSGVWDWDHFAAGESDSLQGWWPVRLEYKSASSLATSDDMRPWWALDYGNQGNYVLNNAQGRARGVLSYWHVDGGSSATQTIIPGTNPAPMTWTPLAGAGSAWCGLRAHGDLTYTDPIMGVPYNQSVLDFNNWNSPSVSGTSKRFPGYAGQMDQMLYRDVQINSSSATLNLSFLYQTAMSTVAATTAATRTGWFQYDPSVVGSVAVPGPNFGAPNFISNTGIAAPNTQPADSFMVYIGVPVDISAVKLANNAPAPVFDLKRRWLSEVIALDKPIKQLLHVAGNTNTSFAISGESMAPFYASQTGVTRYLRIVFRCKTNRGFDDLTSGDDDLFSSNGKGAVLLDNVSIGGTGLSGGAVGVNTFESATDINNGVATDALALGAWRATGKPPAIFFHTHPLTGANVGGGNIYNALVYQDLCGSPSASVRYCNMSGVVISAGDHDNAEAAGGLVGGMPERERMDGIVSPTINLSSSSFGDYNAMGINDVIASSPSVLQYDVYTGAFNLNFTGNAWWFGCQSYPCTQGQGGSSCWGDLRIPGIEIFYDEPRCFTDVEELNGQGLIYTTNASGVPDSMRVLIGKIQECFRFAVNFGCSPTSGAYFDNVAVGFIAPGHSPAETPRTRAASVFPQGAIQVYPWNWINDTFPANDGTSVVPGVAVAPGTAGFDTASAYIKTGLNIAQETGNTQRFDIPADTTVITAGGSNLRVDMIFRIKPGVGNFMAVGDKTSRLRYLPTNPTTPAVAGDASFWGQYLADNGAFGTGGNGFAGPGHPMDNQSERRWDPNFWNSARCDTAEMNLFPVASKGNLPGIIPGYWASMYHEADPKYPILGIVKPRCFLINPAGPVGGSNINCGPGAPPPWTGIPGSGYDFNPVTREYTKIIPDGLLTVGSHVEYFFRASWLFDPGTYVAVPDSNYVVPQYGEGSLDGHRWQEFSVLPDRWKNQLFNDNGQGMACMLYVDWNDRRGNERVWVSIADSLGATRQQKWGAHNGWHAYGNGANINDPNWNLRPDLTQGFVSAHGGQAGTSWDMFGVKAAESITTQAGTLGSRLAPPPNGVATGKESRQGPTPDMLRTYYGVLLILTGDLRSGILGPFANRGQDDVRILKEFMPMPPPPFSTRRAVWIMGDGFVQSEWAIGQFYPDHLDLLNNFLGLSIKTPGGVPQYSYQSWSGNYNPLAGLNTAGPIAGDLYAVGNSCQWGNDVLAVVPNGLNAVASSYYQDWGVNGPYVAGVYTPIQPGKNYESFVDGWDVQHLYSAYDFSSLGRIGYFWKVFNQMTAAGLCQNQGTPLIALDVPGVTDGHVFTDFVQVRNNPLINGRANIHFGLSQADRVTATVYDVAGRLVRVLADRNFPAGEHDLYWDGQDDTGRILDRGVYFTRLRYEKTRFADSRKITLLR